MTGLLVSRGQMRSAILQARSFGARGEGGGPEQGPNVPMDRDVLIERVSRSGCYREWLGFCHYNFVGLWHVVLHCRARTVIWALACGKTASLLILPVCVQS